MILAKIISYKRWLQNGDPPPAPTLSLLLHYLHNKVKLYFLLGLLIVNISTDSWIFILFEELSIAINYFGAQFFPGLVSEHLFMLVLVSFFHAPIILWTIPYFLAQEDGSALPTTFSALGLPRNSESFWWGVVFWNEHLCMRCVHCSWWVNAAMSSQQDGLCE